MADFDPGDYYVPQKQMNILCTGRQVDDAMCDYLADVFHNRRKDSENTSWLDKKSSDPARRSNSALITHGGRSSKELPLLQPSRELRSSLKYRLLSNKELWRHNVIDGCSHGQRLLGHDHENLPCVKYCNKKWGFFSAKTAMEKKPTDVCKAKHNHACEQYYSDRSSKEVRTSQVSRRLLQVLSFKEGDGRMISMPVKKPKNGTSGIIVHFGHDVPGDRKGDNGRTHVLNVEPPKTVAQETELVAKIKKLSHGKPLTPVLFTASLLRSGGGLSPKTASPVEGEGSSVRKLSEFR